MKMRLAILGFAVAGLALLPATSTRAQGTSNTDNTSTTAVDSTSAPAPLSANHTLAVAVPSAAPSPNPTAAGDSGHRIDVFLGYSFISSGYGETRELAHGYAGSVTFNINRNFGIMADFSGHNHSSNPPFNVPADDQDQDLYYLVFGPTVSHHFGNARVSGHALVGIAQQRFSVSNPGITNFGQKDRNFAMAIGGSFDWIGSGHFGWRVLDVDYIFTQTLPIQLNSVVHNIRFSTGLLIRF